MERYRGSEQSAAGVRRCCRLRLVFDLTIGREINRIPVADGLGFMAFSSDGRYLLVTDGGSPTLNVIDVAHQQLVRKVTLFPAMGTGAS